MIRSERAGHTIEHCNTRRSLTSDGHYTVEVEIELRSGAVGLGSAPRGTTTGSHDVPTESADDALTRSGELLDLLVGRDATDQERIDDELSATFGANAFAHQSASLATAASLALISAASMVKGVPMWRHIANYYGATPSLPQLVVNVLSGGGHHGGVSPLTEAMVITPRNASIVQQIDIAVEYFRAARSMFHGNSRAEWPGSGLEGGTTAVGGDVASVLSTLTKVCASDSRFDTCEIGVDMAGNWLKAQTDQDNRQPPEPSDYHSWVVEYPRLTYIEDPFGDRDDEPWAQLVQSVGATKVLVVGDDLLASTRERLTRAIASHLITGSIAKIDQVGTLTEMVRFVELSKKKDIACIVSHRSQETDLPYIVDIAVGLGADFLKAGNCARERIVKYNRLLRIADVQSSVGIQAVELNEKES